MQRIIIAIIALTLAIMGGMIFSRYGTYNEPICRRCSSGAHVVPYYFGRPTPMDVDSCSFDPMGKHGGDIAKADSPVWYCTKCCESWGNYKTKDAFKNRFIVIRD